MPHPGSHAEFVAQAAHPLDDARADLAHFFGRKRALGRAHRQPEGDALLAFLERRRRSTGARTRWIPAAARRRMPRWLPGLPACSRRPAITERSKALEGIAADGRVLDFAALSGLTTRRSRSRTAARPDSTSDGCSSNRRPTVCALPQDVGGARRVLERTRLGGAGLARPASGIRRRA